MSVPEIKSKEELKGMSLKDLKEYYVQLQMLYIMPGLNKLNLKSMPEKDQKKLLIRGIEVVREDGELREESGSEEEAPQAPPSPRKKATVVFTPSPKKGKPPSAQSAPSMSAIDKLLLKDGKGANKKIDFASGVITNELSPSQKIRYDELNEYPKRDKKEGKIDLIDILKASGIDVGDPAVCAKGFLILKIMKFEEDGGKINLEGAGELRDERVSRMSAGSPKKAVVDAPAPKSSLKSSSPSKKRKSISFSEEEDVAPQEENEEVPDVADCGEYNREELLRKSLDELKQMLQSKGMKPERVDDENDAVELLCQSSMNKNCSWGVGDGKGCDNGLVCNLTTSPGVCMDPHVAVANNDWIKLGGKLFTGTPATMQKIRAQYKPKPSQAQIIDAKDARDAQSIRNNLIAEIVGKTGEPASKYKLMALKDLNAYRNELYSDEVKSERPKKAKKPPKQIEVEDEFEADFEVTEPETNEENKTVEEEEEEDGKTVEEEVVVTPPQDINKAIQKLKSNDPNALSNFNEVQLAVLKCLGLVSVSS